MIRGRRLAPHVPLPPEPWKEMESVNQRLTFFRRPLRQIRWQLVLAFLLSALASIFLLIIFGGLLVGMLVQRAAVNTIERQVELLARVTLSATERSLRTPAAATDHPLGAGLPLRVERAVSCGNVGPGVIPSWLGDGGFHGVVSEENRVLVKAVVQGREGSCRVASIGRMAVSAEVAQVLSEASWLRVETPGPPQGRSRRSGAGPPGGRPAAVPGEQRQTPPAPSWLALRRILGWTGSRGSEYVPVVMTAHDWQSGGRVDKVLVRVQPRFDLAVRQAAQYGQRSAAWVWLLPAIGVVFLAIEVLTFRLVLGIIHRIASAVETLAAGVRRIGTGQLAHRVDVQRPQELAVLSEGVNQMAASLERMMEETRAKARLEEEIRLAGETQRSLYPRQLPAIPGVELAAHCEPARIVSGDLYDAMELAPGRIGLLCADVSGKGMAAALLMSNLQAIARALLRIHGNGPGGGAEMPHPCRLVTEINRDLWGRIPDNRFVTLFWAEYDCETSRLRYTNAGHCPPLLFDSGGGPPLRLETGGLPVGLFREASFSQAELLLAPGSLLVIYTDGVSEAPDAGGEEFGEERLSRHCQERLSSPAAALAESIRKAVDGWTAGNAREDDAT